MRWWPAVVKGQPEINLQKVHELTAAVSVAVLQLGFFVLCTTACPMLSLCPPTMACVACLRRFLVQPDVF